MDTWDRIFVLRSEFAAQAEALAPTDWDAPSLCEGWRIRDVVAHLILPERFSGLGGLGGLIRSGFRLDRYIHQDAIRRGSVPVADLMASYRVAVPRRSVPPGRRPGNVLVDLVVHLQDIRRALELPWSYDAELLETVASTLYADTGLGVPKRVQGLALRATDTAWKAGEGAVVAGPLEALILAMTGRPVTLPELTGPGVALLVARIGKHNPSLPG